MEVKCEVDDGVCFIASATITKPRTVITLIDEKNQKINHENIWKIHFNNTTVNFVPRILNLNYENVTEMHIWSCGLKEIYRNDLENFANLEYLYLSDNDLTFLPDDLLENTKKLVKIAISGNQIGAMSPKLLKPIMKNEIQWVDLSENSKVDVFYCPKVPGSVESVAELMWTIDSQILEPETAEISCNLEKCDDFSKAKKIFEILYNFNGISDFSIVVGLKVFKVHRGILAAQCEGFAELQPETDRMRLDGFSTEAVDAFLHFLYTGQLNKNTKHSVEIFELAAKLKVPELKVIMANLILEKVDEENAGKIFSLAHKYESEELKQKSFKIIQKLVPGLVDNLVNDVTAVEGIIKTKGKTRQIEKQHNSN